MPVAENHQDAPRKELVAGSVNDAEKAEVDKARVTLGYGSMSEYVREVMLGRSREVNQTSQAAGAA